MPHGNKVVTVLGQRRDLKDAANITHTNLFGCAQHISAPDAHKLESLYRLILDR